MSYRSYDGQPWLDEWFDIVPLVAIYFFKTGSPYIGLKKKNTHFLRPVDAIF